MREKKKERGGVKNKKEPKSEQDRERDRVGEGCGWRWG